MSGGTAALARARPLVDALVSASGGSSRVVLLYGSRLLDASPDEHSAWDFVVVVDDYRAFYRAMRDAGEIHRPVWLMSALARVLPPNVVAFTPDEGHEGIAKCLVVSRVDFQRALGPRPPDHFLLGRMVQKVGLAWSRTEEDAAWTRACLDGARGRILDWMAPYLEGSFDAVALGRRMLEVCYGSEFRPEARNRSARVFEPQAEHFREVLSRVLKDASAAGEVEAVAGGYRLVREPGPARRLRWRWHFIRSKARTTARWLKHIVTFDNWLPYISRKVERRTGRPVELSAWERRAPLIFLWPRAIRVLTDRPEREAE